ncbi:MAG: 50S ribosomal protein L32 [Candidatus Marinimicrobia bacterium]|jgi:large subunit ribosomal protein L32|nr:50S ribosomal protein L32 [Candidatus Neomarinimicrobiota bacterium]MDP6568657.1 50S ribosomal protein L32 [Candidatus Neomarinimicrobiota bacterium]MDP7026558.1 50S ribosomal protein L32 [Candidatus Neomarinimicrobiota bacterium]
MALPKRRQTKTRGRKRRTHWKAKAPQLSSCPQCHQAKLPHRACPNCGYYRGRPVISSSD